MPLPLYSTYPAHGKARLRQAAGFGRRQPRQHIQTAALGRQQRQDPVIVPVVYPAQHDGLCLVPLRCGSRLSPVKNNANVPGPECDPIRAPTGDIMMSPVPAAAHARCWLYWASSAIVAVADEHGLSGGGHRVLRGFFSQRPATRYDLEPFQQGSICLQMCGSL